MAFFLILASTSAPQNLPLFLLFICLFDLFIYVFWLCWVLVAAGWLLVVAGGLLSYSMQTLSCLGSLANWSKSGIYGNNIGKYPQNLKEGPTGFKRQKQSFSWNFSWRNWQWISWHCNEGEWSEATIFCLSVNSVKVPVPQRLFYWSQVTFPLLGRIKG